MTKILVVAEHQDGEIKKSTFATLSLVKQLAEKTGASFDLLVIAEDASAYTSALEGYGAGQIFAASGEVFKNYLAQPYATAIAEAAEKSAAQYVVAPDGTFAKDVMPRVAGKLGAGMVADCVGLADGDDLLYKRPMYAGNIIATVKVNTPKTVITVRASEFDELAASGGQSPVVALESAAEQGGASFVSLEKSVSDRPDLTEAEVVVSGGRGLKDAENFWGIMNPLADLFGAAIGATRAVVDSFTGVPNDMQVGQTGKVVAPKLYIAVALSGAIQHLAGMKNSKTIVAINRDADAPIFQIADYGLVADAFTAVPEFIEKVKEVQ